MSERHWTESEENFGASFHNNCIPVFDNLHCKNVVEKKKLITKVHGNGKTVELNENCEMESVNHLFEVAKRKKK